MCLRVRVCVCLYSCVYMCVNIRGCKQQRVVGIFVCKRNREREKRSVDQTYRKCMKAHSMCSCQWGMARCLRTYYCCRWERLTFIWNIFPFPCTLTFSFRPVYLHSFQSHVQLLNLTSIKEHPVPSNKHPSKLQSPSPFLIKSFYDEADVAKAKELFFWPFTHALISSSSHPPRSWQGRTLASLIFHWPF